MTPEEIILKFTQLENEITDLRYILARKTGLGSADIRSRIRSGSTVVLGTGDINSSGMFGAGVVDQAAIGANAVGQSEVKTELGTVSITAGNSSGTATVTSGNVILGFYPVTNCDQIVKNVSISGTTLTVNLNANATADTTIKVQMLKT